MNSLRSAALRISYDHGGDDCPESGSFYFSSDRGRSWVGAFEFTGFDILVDEHCTARTCVVGNKVIMTFADKDQWGTDYPVIAEHDGQKFSRGPALFHGVGRAAMPSVAWAGDRLVAAVRRRAYGERDGWIDAFCSDDLGQNWRFISRVGETGNYNGNPPALIASSDKLICAYGNRTERRICAKVSEDGGGSWSSPITVRDGGDTDIGYPQLFMRSDGVPVCVYYWADEARPQQHIVATAMEV